jgi:hypothetical protein
MGNSNRSNLGISKVPGPGSYDPGHNKSGLSFSMGAKIKIEKSDFAPGPGQYQPP